MILKRIIASAPAAGILAVSLGAVPTLAEQERKFAYVNDGTANSGKVSGLVAMRMKINNMMYR